MNKSMSTLLIVTALCTQAGCDGELVGRIAQGMFSAVSQCGYSTYGGSSHHAGTSSPSGSPMVYQSTTPTSTSTGSSSYVDDPRIEWRDAYHDLTADADYGDPFNPMLDDLVEWAICPGCP